MEAFITAFNRIDLMSQTVASLNECTELRRIIIHEDSKSPSYNIQAFENGYPNTLIYKTEGIGQHKSIEMFLENNKEKIITLFSEEDWSFFADYDWIKLSVKLLEEYPNVIKVLARKGSPHLCKHTKSAFGIPYGFIEPWQSTDGILWHGFSWNPGVTRADYLREFIPFPKWEQDLAEKIYNKGYRVIELGRPVYEHIGDNKSTH